MMDKEIKTSGGPFVGKDVNTQGGDFIGGDKINSDNAVSAYIIASVSAIAIIIIGIMGILALIKDGTTQPISPVSSLSFTPNPSPIPVVFPPAPAPTPVLDKLRIGIAEFSHHEGVKPIDVDLYIYNELDRHIKQNQLEIEPYRLKKTVDEFSFEQIGKDHGCTLLIWGWYDEHTITPRVERIATPTCHPQKDLQNISSIPIRDPAQFEFSMTTLQEQISYLVLLTLASDQYANKKYIEAGKLLEEALEGKSCDGSFNASEAFRLSGDLHKEKGEFVRAIDDYECAITLDDKDPRSVYHLGQAIQERDGNDNNAKRYFDTARELWGNLVDSKPLSYKLRQEAAFFYLFIGDQSKAIENFEYAMKNLKPESSVAHRDLGYAYRMAGKPDEAIKELERAVELNPKDTDAYTNLGLAYEAIGSKEQALTAYAAAIDACAIYSLPHKRRGFLLVNSEKYDEAIKDFNSVVSLEPKEPIAYRDLGYALRIKGDNLQQNDQLELAIQNLATATTLAPNDPDAYLNLGLAYKSLKEDTNAVENLQKAISLANSTDWIKQKAREALSGLDVSAK